MSEQIICKYCGRSYPLYRNNTDCDGCGNPMFQVREAETVSQPYGIVGFFYETFEAIRTLIDGLWGAV